MEKNNFIYIKQILDFLDSIENYITEKTFEQFQSEEMLQAAVLRKIELIGEAANRLSPEFIDSYKELPIREAISVRNRLIHEYDDIDLKIIWDTITVDLPHFKILLKQIQDTNE